MKKYVVVGIILLFIITSVTPMVVGYKSDDYVSSESEELLDNLAFYCLDASGSNAKYEYYKECILNDFSNNDPDNDKAVEPVESSTIASYSGPMDSPWPMKCHDLHHTGRSPISTADNPYDELWKFEFDFFGDTSPAIGPDGIIYVGGGTEVYKIYLFAFYPNGTVKWKYQVDGIILRSCPAIAEDGTIYIGSWDHYLHAVNPDGTRKWKFDADADIVSSPAIAEDGTIYFGGMGPGYYGRIYAINPNGTEKWRYQTGYYITSDPAIGDDGTIYIGSGDDYLYAMYPNGTFRWRYKTGDWVTGPPSIADDGTVYIGSFDGYLYAIYPNGTLRWKTEIWYGSGKNPTLGLDGTIYISSASKLFAISPEDGDIDWEFDLGGSSGKSSSAICADGIIYTGIEIGDRDGGEIVAVNSDGTEHWRQRISNQGADSSPAIGSDGTIYICSSSTWSSEDWGHLHAFGRGELTSNTNGPYQGIINEPIQFAGSATGGYLPYTYYWDFGDEETSEEQNPTHEYENAENFTVTLTVTDDNDTVAVDTTWALIRESNEPPNTPSIDGETEGNYGEPYDYTFITTDLDGDDVWYYIEWGDGDVEEWIGPYSSGEEVVRSHTWDDQGEYTIRAKARDIFDAESDWGYLEVTMPVNQQSSDSLFLWFLERFPIFEKLLPFFSGNIYNRMEV